jgi:YVTN family beta-propeller protein
MADDGVSGDGNDPDESAPAHTPIARIRLGDQVSDIVTCPNNSAAYAALGDSIAVISNLHTVSCLIPIGGHPKSLAVDAAGRRLYATNYDDSVSMMDMASHRVHVIAGACCALQVDTADGESIYAAGNARNSDGSFTGWVSVGDAKGATVGVIAGFDGYRINDLAAEPEGGHVYVGLARECVYYQYEAGSVGVIDTTTNAPVDTIDLGASPDTITVSPDGSRMYATHYDQGLVSAIDLVSRRVTPIALADSPLGVNITPDGLQAYVSSRRSLSIIDTVAHEAARIVVGDLPRCVQVSPDGKYAYVSNFGDRSVSVIDTIAQCVTDTIDVGGYPEALAVSPDGHRLYVGDYWSGTVTLLSVQP